MAVHFCPSHPCPICNPQSSSVVTLPVVRIERNEESAAPCPSCLAKSEHWWSYCAMCGYHIASGSNSPAVRTLGET
jgi:hypothetical protein